MVLRRCVAMSPKEFLEDVFNRRHLYTPAAEHGGDFTDLFSAHALEDLLANTGLRTSSVRLVRSGEEFDVSRGSMVESGDAPGTPPLVSTEVIRAGIASGHTLILRSLHRYHPPLRRFAHQLSAELGHPVRVNAFITPPGSQGVNLHFDVQDVLVLQIAGEKHWQLKTQPLVDPLPQQAWFDVSERRREELRSASTPLADLVMRPGDTLYFPRGTMHSPRTEDSLSIHLTVAIPQITHHDLLIELVSEVVEDDWLRSSVSLAKLENDVERTRTVLLRIAERLSAVAATTSPADLLWNVRTAKFGELPPEPIPVLPPTQPADSHRMRDGVRYRMVLDGDSLSLQGPGRKVRLPATIGPVLDELRDTGIIDQQRLAAELSAPVAEQLVRALTDFGLITAHEPQRLGV